ncbi:MAG: P-II family nitrogen regulator [Desulfobacterales bacterium]|nr:P-II family nitrogen regulator [Desulfobacterales bacterium]
MNSDQCFPAGVQWLETTFTRKAAPGPQRGHMEIYRGAEDETNGFPKIKIEVVGGLSACNFYIIVVF